MAGCPTECAIDLDRLERLRDRALAGPDTPIGFRALAHARTVTAMPDSPPILRRSHALARTLREFPLSIDEDSLLAGHHLFGERAGRDGWFDFPEFAPHLFNPPGDALRAALEHSDLAESERDEVLQCIGAAHLFAGDHVSPPLPPEVALTHEACVIIGGGSTVNHSVRDYAKVLSVGFEGIARSVDDRLASWDMAAPDQLEARTFLAAASAVAHAAADLGRRYAEVARAAGLDEMAAICERVPAQPARTLREAVQALWLAHTITCCEDHINANSIGRIDQILWPYYEADLAAGRTTEERAIELLMHLHLKLFRDYDVQQAMVGGRTASGEDATNPLSYLVLEATRRLGLVRCLSVRIHQDSPTELLERATDLVAAGGGIPFFFNDEAVVPALVEKGIRLEDARDYAAIGCVEITIPGRANPHAVSHNINLAKCLELALHNGFDPRTGKRIGPETGPLESMNGAEEVYAAYCRQVEHFARCGVFISNAGQHSQAHSFPLTYRSLLTAECVDRGRDITAGGARYNYHSCSAIGIPNVADSLAAIDRVVFAEGRLTLSDLRELLLGDFEGAEAERQHLLHAPKYGNDLPEVDEWAARAASDYCELMASHRTHYGGSFHVHLFSFLWHVDPFGKTTGALPDGRRAGEPLAYSLSPGQGRDAKGITALIASLARLPHRQAAGSSSAIIELSPRFFEGNGRARFVQLLRAAVEMGVGQMQFNVVSAERLIQAQEDPEHYGNIVVRVSGFSQRFASIHKDLQDHIIARVKHES